MKRNTALFGASLVAGVAAASGLVMTGGPSSAAPGDTFYGVAWADGTSGSTSGGWQAGTYADPFGFVFAGRASAGKGTFHLTSNGGATVSVATTCVAGKPAVAVVGGGAAGVHTGGSVTLAKFTGAANVQGSVTFATQKVGTHTVGAYINFAPGLAGTWVALTGADCAAVPTSTPPPTTNPPSSTTNPPTSTPPPTTNPPTSTPPPTTNPPTSTPPPTTNPPTSTGTNPPTTAPPTSTTTNPPTTAPTTQPPTTEPPTPTPITTTLPVTG